jgi:hypothetical protein
MMDKEAVEYDAPTITELGSVAEFTRAEWFTNGHDNFLNSIRGS